jgi:hypothetical protein
MDCIEFLVLGSWLNQGRPGEGILGYRGGDEVPGFWFLVGVMEKLKC